MPLSSVDLPEPFGPTIAVSVPGRTDVQCLHRWQKVLRPGEQPRR